MFILKYLILWFALILILLQAVFLNGHGTELPCVLEIARGCVYPGHEFQEKSWDHNTQDKGSAIIVRQLCKTHMRTNTHMHTQKYGCSLQAL